MGQKRSYGSPSRVAPGRSAGVDLLTGTGLAAALDRADVVIDVSNTTTLSRSKSVRFFETVTGQLLAAEVGAGVRHHVALSIVGVDRVPVGYYAGKLRQEALIEAGLVPWTGQGPGRPGARGTRGHRGRP
jgi:uncharacterized protein YbjT (DUF2867 family)